MMPPVMKINTPCFSIILFLFFQFSLIAHAADIQGAEPNMAGTAEVNLFDIVWILAVFGAFGGMLAALSESSLREIRELGIKAYGSVGRFFACLGIGALWGIGGAFAFGAIASMDKKFDSFDNSKRISFALISVATGFAGLQFLILVSRRLAKEVDAAVQQRTQQVREELEEKNEKKSKQLEDLNEAQNALTHALSIAPGDPLFNSITHEAKRKAEKAFQEYPANRTLAILFARLECECLSKDNYDRAISLLSETIGDWKRCKKPLDEDFAALLFNRACYSNIKAELVAKAGDDPKAEALRQTAWNDLKESCQLDSYNKDEAHNDASLQSLVNGTTRKWESL